MGCDLRGSPREPHPIHNSFISPNCRDHRSQRDLPREATSQQTFLGSGGGARGWTKDAMRMLEAKLHREPKSGKGSQGEDINLRKLKLAWSPFPYSQGDEQEEATVSSCCGCGITLCNCSVLHVRDGEGVLFSPYFM